MYMFDRFSEAYCERVQQAGAQCGNSRFFPPKQHLSVNLDNTVSGKANRDQTVKGNPGRN